MSDQIFKFKPMDVVFGDNIVKPRRLIVRINPEFESFRYEIISERMGHGSQSENSLRTLAEWLVWIEHFRDELTGREIRDAIEYAKAPFEEPKEWGDFRKRFNETGNAFIN